MVYGTVSKKTCISCKYGEAEEGLIEDKENHNGTLGQLKTIREKMKKQLDEYFQELSTNPTPKRTQKLDLKVAMLREALADNHNLMGKERSKHERK